MNWSFILKYLLGSTTKLKSQLKLEKKTAESLLLAVQGHGSLSPITISKSSIDHHHEHSMNGKNASRNGGSSNLEEGGGSDDNNDESASRVSVGRSGGISMVPFSSAARVPTTAAAKRSSSVGANGRPPTSVHDGGRMTAAALVDDDDDNDDTDQLDQLDQLQRGSRGGVVPQPPNDSASSGRGGAMGRVVGSNGGLSASLRQQQLEMQYEQQQLEWEQLRQQQQRAYPPVNGYVQSGTPISSSSHFHDEIYSVASELTAPSMMGTPIMPPQQYNQQQQRGSASQKPQRGMGSQQQHGTHSKYARMVVQDLDVAGPQAAAVMSVVDQVSQITDAQLRELDPETRQQILQIRRELGLPVSIVSGPVSASSTAGGSLAGSVGRRSVTPSTMSRGNSSTVGAKQTPTYPLSSSGSLSGKPASSIERNRPLSPASIRSGYARGMVLSSSSSSNNHSNAGFMGADTPSGRVRALSVGSASRQSNAGTAGNRSTAQQQSDTRAVDSSFRAGAAETQRPHSATTFLNRQSNYRGAATGGAAAVPLSSPGSARSAADPWKKQQQQPPLRQQQSIQYNTYGDGFGSDDDDDGYSQLDG